MTQGHSCLYLGVGSSVQGAVPAGHPQGMVSHVMDIKARLPVSKTRGGEAGLEVRYYRSKVRVGPGLGGLGQGGGPGWGQRQSLLRTGKLDMGQGQGEDQVGLGFGPVQTIWVRGRTGHRELEMGWARSLLAAGSHTLKLELTSYPG